MVYVLLLLIGVFAGLRALTPIAVVSWAAWLGWIDFSGTPMFFLGNIVTVILLTLLALGELVSDQLPNTPSRKVPPQFVARIALGGAAGALLLPGSWIVGAVLGAIGAVIGTLGGAEARARLAKSFGADRPAALLEDAVAIIGSLLVVWGLS